MPTIPVKTLDPDAYTIGWICALPMESAAAQAFLDERHEVPSEVSDSNSYVAGRIGKHNVVIGVMPHNEYGTTSAATTAKDMVRSFPQIRLGLMVGIGGGAPSQKHDIRLGDVVVSSCGKGTGGVIQFDYGKTIQGQDFEETGHLNQPPAALMTAAAALDAQYLLDGPQLNDKVDNALDIQRKKFREKYARPLNNTDRLYRPEVAHTNDLVGDCTVTCGVDPEHLVTRTPRGKDDDNPSVHYGLIASSNSVMKDAIVRDRLIQRGVLCFEMEAAGLMNHFPCLVVRGICDYSDSHKNSHWQPYAAMVAAAYAKDLLGRVNPAGVNREKKILDVINSVASNQKEQNRILRETKIAVDSIDLQNRAQSLEKWLRPADPSDNAERAREKRYSNTGTWFLESIEFQKWLTDGYQHLCLYGLGGCGKTVLSSTILDCLRESQGTVILYFFFDFNDPEKSTVSGLVRSLLFQLHELGEATDKINKMQERHENIKSRPSTKDLIHCLKDILEHTGPIFILIDALDECNLEEREQDKLIRWMIEVGSSPSHKHVKIIATARPEAAFLERLSTDLAYANYIHLNKRAIKNDIQSYIMGCLRDSPGFHTHAPHHPTVEKISRILIQKADGMFRYAACQIDDIVNCLGPEEIEDVLNSLPDTIQETYKRSIERIPQRYSAKAIRLLQFLVNLNRPLPLAAAVDIVSVRSGFQKFSPADRIRPEDITRLCPNLLSVVEFKSSLQRNEESELHLAYQWNRESELHLAHLSVKEYLLQYDGAAIAFIGLDANVSIVRTCLSYLASALVKDFITEEKESEQWGFPLDIAQRMKRAFPFTMLAVNMWTTKAVDAESLPEVADEIADHLEMELERKCPWIFRGQEFFDPCTLGCLHFACYFGLQATAKVLIKRGADVDDSARKEARMTPIEFASYGGHLKIVQLLLDAGVSPNSKGATAHGSALRLSCKMGHPKITKLLARKGANLNRMEGDVDIEKYPVQIAIEKNDVTLVQLLLDEGADANADCGFFGTPLQTAARIGFYHAVEVLLGHGASVNAKGGAYGHALQAAAESGDLETLRLLLEHGADVHAPGNSKYENAIDASIRLGYEDIVKLLSDKGAGVNAKGGAYRRAFHSAVENGRGEIVKLLLDNGQDANDQDLKDVTPLTMACIRKAPEMAKDLLDKGANPNVDARGFGNTLQVFLDKGYWTITDTSILRILLEAGAEIQSQTSPSRNGLQIAVKNGLLEPIKILLGQGADPNVVVDASQPYFNHTLLMESLFKNLPEVAQQLLQFGAGPNAKTSRRLPNQTALHLAMDGDLEEIVRLLLKKGADLNTLSGFPSFTPLQLSVKKGSVKYTRLFLEHGADVEALGGYRNNLTAIKLAEKAGNGEIIQLLQQAATERMGGNQREGETEIGMPENLQKRGE